MSKYTELVRSISAPNWGTTTTNTNIPEHPVEIFSSQNGRYEVEISPVNGYDDGELHEEHLEFFVNIFEYNTYDEENDEWLDVIQTAGKQFNTAESAVSEAQKRIAALSE